MLKFCIWAVAVMLCSQMALASELTGVVRDPQGKPVSQAVVEVVGSNIRTSADAEGRFTLENLITAEVELHVMAPGYTHRHVHADVGTGQLLSLTLARTVLDVVDIVALPWHASVLESSHPVNVLAGESLRERQASTLGDTLKHEVGIHSNYYGPVASSPIIRGLEGPRVLIVQNNLDAGDASRVGPDHAVATEASTATQIEVLRGPATLLHGSGAIGGVVNIVDGRVPVDNHTRGEWQLGHSTAADESWIAGNVTGGRDRVAVYADAFWRDGDNYRIPGQSESRLANSAAEASGVNLGTSYLLDNGHVGLSWGRLERTYGIPGHSHGGGDMEDDVYADLEQDRIQLHAELSLQNPWISAVNTRIGYTDYQHREIEHGAVGTVFENKTLETRIDVLHHPLAGWRGNLNLQYKHSDFSAEGDEAFSPPSETTSLALALVEERHMGDVLLQLGARIERVEMRTDSLMGYLPLVGEHNHGTVLVPVYAVDQVFEPASVSAGLVWDFTPGYNLALSVSRAQRAPSASELYSFGAHIGTRSFEVGALFELEDDGQGGVDVVLSTRPVDMETSSNIDISLRKLEGDVGFVVNAFYNRINDYYYQRATPWEAENAHDHEHGHGDHHHDDEEGLPVYVFSAEDVTLYGLETQFVWQALTPLKLTLNADYIRAERVDGGNLPRIPPLRLAGIARYTHGAFDAELSISHYFKQSRVAVYETETDGYTLVDAQLNYRLATGGSHDVTLFVQGNNLTNELARVHSSFLKDLAPLPARSFSLGIRGRF